jgi:hypothetical protein
MASGRYHESADDSERGCRVRLGDEERQCGVGQ